MSQDEAFDRWVRSSAPALHRFGYVLTGDQALAQDLVQHACTKTWSHWRTVEAPDAYVRAVMARTASSWWRRKWHGEVPTDDLAALGLVEDPWGEVDPRDALARALRLLTPRQRAVVVLRFYDDRSEAQTAQALGIALGTVKSTTARALQVLREQGLAEQNEVSS